MEYNLAEISKLLTLKHEKVIFIGPMGSGKSTLLREIADHAILQGKNCWGLCLDPGRPDFGCPGSLSLAKRVPSQPKWQIQDFEALGTLDVARFRLPLLTATSKLLQHVPNCDLLLIDTPGMVSGVPAEEFLEALVQTIQPTQIITLTPRSEKLPFIARLESSNAPVHWILSNSKAQSPTHSQKLKARTENWQAFLKQSKEFKISLDQYRLEGLLKPFHAPDDWSGRQIVLKSQKGKTIGFGEILTKNQRILTIRAHLSEQEQIHSLLIRDAQNKQDGFLRTNLPPLPSPRKAKTKPLHLLGERSGLEISWTLPPLPEIKGARFTTTLVNFPFGDPMVGLHLQREKRWFFFDIGSFAKLPAKTAHQITDIFISHAHVDHVSGFPWLFARRINTENPCRIYGPPGLTAHFQAMSKSFTWDRLAEKGPVFQVGELHGEKIHWSTLQVGEKDLLGSSVTDAPRGKIIDEPTFQVHAQFLDHGIPVLAFALEEAPHYKVDHQRREQAQIPPGSWIAELQQLCSQGKLEQKIKLPDNRTETPRSLIPKLLTVTSGQKIVYATDFMDSPENRNALQSFAKNAHIFICESSYSIEDKAHATRTGHMTTQAVAEIAKEAGVHNLIPFHFSNRYVKEPEKVYKEIKKIFPNIIYPSILHKKIK